MAQLVEALKVGDSIADGVVANIFSLNSSGCTLALGSKQPLTEMSRLRLKCDGTRAETRFRYSAKRTSTYISAGA